MRTRVVAPLILLAIGACSNGGTAIEPDVADTLDSARDLPSASGVVRTVSGDQTGNRVIDGMVDLSQPPLEIVLDSPAKWIVSGLSEDGAIFMVVSEDGATTSLTVDGDTVTTASHADRNPDAPFLLAMQSSDFWIVEAPSSASNLSAPAMVDGALISKTGDGVVTISSAEATVTVDVIALGDSRFAVDSSDRVAVLSDPTDAYPHGVVGDRVESVTATVFDGRDGEVVGVATAPEGTVFETVAPMWADTNDDGVEELLLTASDATGGARLVIYGWDGALLSSSEPVGNGQRWRNLLGVAEFGEMRRVVDVQTPHIGGIVQWFDVDGDSLTNVARISGYSTHRIGSRNLDQGLIIDADGDGNVDVVVPSQRQDAIAVLGFDATGVAEARRLALPARLSSNLTAVSGEDGKARMAAGLEDGTVLIWR